MNPVDLGAAAAAVIADAIRAVAPYVDALVIAFDATAADASGATAAIASAIDAITSRSPSSCSDPARCRPAWASVVRPFTGFLRRRSMRSAGLSGMDSGGRHRSAYGPTSRASMPRGHDNS